MRATRGAMEEAHREGGVRVRVGLGVIVGSFTQVQVGMNMGRAIVSVVVHMQGAPQGLPQAPEPDSHQGGTNQPLAQCAPPPERKPSAQEEGRRGDDPDAPGMAKTPPRAATPGPPPTVRSQGGDRRQVVGAGQDMQEACRCPGDEGKHDGGHRGPVYRGSEGLYSDP